MSIVTDNNGLNIDDTLFCPDKIWSGYSGAARMGVNLTLIKEPSSPQEVRLTITINIRASNEPSRRFRAFSWLKAPTRAFTFNTLVINYVEQ